MNAHTKNLGPCHQHEGGIYAKEGESIPVVKRREREGTEIHTGATEERVHPALQVASNGTSVLCRKKGWEKENGVRLLVPQ